MIDLHDTASRSAISAWILSRSSHFRGFWGPRFAASTWPTCMTRRSTLSAPRSSTTTFWSFGTSVCAPKQQMAFAEAFGDLDEHPFVEGSGTHPKILDIVTQSDDYTNFGGGWHSDLTFRDQPELGSVLYALEVPDAGGDTLFANQHAAYDALSDTFKAMLGGLQVMHSAELQYGERGMSRHSKAMVTKNEAVATSTEAMHPLVRTHPETGRKGLYANRAFCTNIVGMEPAESAALLEMLY